MAGYSGKEQYAKVLSPEAHCFILDIANGERLGFQLMPEPITESKSALYNEIPIIGRSLPLLGYAGSTSRSINLSLSFVALNKPGAGKWDTAKVRDSVRFLEAKVYPVYKEGFTFPPPLLWLTIGNALGMQCIMTSCSTSWFGPWDASESHPNSNAGDSGGAEVPASAFRATVDCALQEYGLNDDRAQHPQGHDLARKGWNQFLGIPPDNSFGGAQFTDIPLSTPFG